MKAGRYSGLPFTLSPGGSGHRTVVPSIPHAHGLAPAGARTIVVPVAIAAGRGPGQAARHPVSIDPVEVSLGGARAVPAIRPAAPVPATLEEDFILEAFHHLDSGGDDHQLGSGRQADIDADANLRPGNRRADAQDDGQG